MQTDHIKTIGDGWKSLKGFFFFSFSKRPKPPFWVYMNHAEVGAWEMMWVQKGFQCWSRELNKHLQNDIWVIYEPHLTASISQTTSQPFLSPQPYVLLLCICTQDVFFWSIAGFSNPFKLSWQVDWTVWKISDICQVSWVNSSLSYHPLKS